jgi:hypothetical protein
VDEAVRTLRGLEVNSRNEGAPIGETGLGELREAYVRWATNTERQLSAYFPRERIEDLFDSPRHRDICSMPPGGQLRVLINAELDRRSAQFGEIAGELEHVRGLFSNRGVYVAPDTSFYVEHPDKLEEVDFRPLLTIREDPVRIVVPIVVVDELDGLKRSGNQKTRWRAQYTLAVIDRMLAHPPGPGILRLEDFSALDQGIGGIPRGVVTLQIAFDPPGHKRLPINDDEIVDRCLACQTFAKSLTVLTYDTGQATRARLAGLRVHKLTAVLGEEPAPGGAR